LTVIQVHVADDKAAVGLQLAQRFGEWARLFSWQLAFLLPWSSHREAIAVRGRFIVALSGGSALKMLQQGMEKMIRDAAPRPVDLQFSKWQVLLADERLVTTVLSPLSNDNVFWHLVAL
jgi:hypothetical protein